MAHLRGTEDLAAVASASCTHSLVQLAIDYGSSCSQLWLHFVPNEHKTPTSTITHLGDLRATLCGLEPVRHPSGV